MKINRIIIALFSVAILTFSCGEGETKVAEVVKDEVKKTATMESYKLGLDAANSKVMWKGDMLKMYSHEGTVAVRKGELEIENGKLTSGTFSVDMKSITPTDENYKDGKKPADLVGHLSSPDFFDIANHPTAGFKVTNVSGDVATGNMTLRGVTKEEKVTGIKISNDGKTMSVTGNMTLDRKKYGVAFDHPAQEMVLSDDIVLSFDLKAKM